MTDKTLKQKSKKSNSTPKSKTEWSELESKNNENTQTTSRDTQDTSSNPGKAPEMVKRINHIGVYEANRPKDDKWDPIKMWKEEEAYTQNLEMIFEAINISNNNQKYLRQQINVMQQIIFNKFTSAQEKANAKKIVSKKERRQKEWEVAKKKWEASKTAL